MRHLALLSLLFCSAASAQAPSAEVEVVYAVTGVDIDEALRVGELPDVLEEFLPEGATVIGTVRRNPFGSAAVAVARMEADPESAARAFSDLAFPGWENAEEDPWGRAEGGFITDALPARSFKLYPAGEGESVVTVSFQSRPWGGSFVLLSLTSVTQDQGLQQMRAAGGARPGGFETLQSELPTLASPGSKGQRGTGGGGSGERYHSTALLESDLGLNAVIAHYDGQMEAAGWTRFGSLLTDSHAASSWTRPHADGTPLIATL